MDSSRLIRKNGLAVKLVIALGIARIVFSIINNWGDGRIPITIFMVVVCLAVIGGNAFLGMVKSDSELIKFTSVLGFLPVAFLAIFVEGSSVSGILPVFGVLLICMIYLDERLSFFAAIVCEVLMLIKVVVVIAGGVKENIINWIAVFLFITIFNLGINLVCKLTTKYQATDKQEIEYHLAYQQEITGNMVSVVDRGNMHIEQLQAKLDGFQVATEEVVKSVDAISDGVTDSVENMETQTDMTRQIQEVIDELINVKDQTLKSADHAVNITERSISVIGRLKGKSKDIDAVNSDVTVVSQELCDKILSAEEITQIIYQISSQTNLLALNASIEAARAGEAGRGFAVVADEIRKLADDTRASIDKITELLQGVTLLANRTSDLVRKSVEAVNEQGEFIEQVDSSFHTISNVVEELHGNMTSLDSLSDNLRESNNHIVDGLSNQQAASEQIAANAQSSAALCQTNLEELVDVINELNEIATIIGSLSADGEDSGHDSAPEPTYAQSSEDVEAVAEDESDEW